MIRRYLFPFLPTFELWGSAGRERLRTTRPTASRLVLPLGPAAAGRPVALFPFSSDEALPLIGPDELEPPELFPVLDPEGQQLVLRINIYSNDIDILY